MLYGNPFWEIANGIDNKFLRMGFLAGFAIEIAGAILLIMHWPGARLMITIGPLFALVCYLISFFRIEKTSENYLNLMLILSFCIGSVLKFNHLHHAEYLLYIAGAILVWKFFKSMAD